MPRMLEAFGDLFEPQEALEPILARPVRLALNEWLTEIWAADELVGLGIGPRRRAMFDGPPGVGKTTLAHHLSARLGLPMLAVRPDRLVSKYVGEMGKNIGDLFDLAANDDEPIVLFIDEFDALSRQRRRGESGADDSRNEEVDVLLQRIEQHKGFLIAATNFADHIDQAIWRRFDVHITLALPEQRERELILARYLAPFGLPDLELSALATSTETASAALLRALCEGLKRQTVIGPKLGSDMSKGAVFERVLSTVHPHPHCGKPRLWSLMRADPGLARLGWPFRRAEEIEREPASAPRSASVVPIGRRP